MGEATGLDTTSLIRTSRLVAKIDSAAVQDGYNLYLHGFFAAIDGQWCIVQQGMNPQQKEARRYHWQSENAPGFFDSPHSAIEGRNAGSIVNLADKQAGKNRQATLELVHAGPDPLIGLLRRWTKPAGSNLELFGEEDPGSQLNLPSHHEVRASNIDLKRLHATLAAAADRGPKDFSDLLLTPGVGARTVASLAFVAEVIHGAPYRFKDPARFALAHGGKDGHPFPVPLKVYDETISVLKRAVDRANLGRRESLSAIKRLDDQARLLDGVAAGPSLAEYLEAERRQSASYEGRTVQGPSSVRNLT